MKENLECPKGFVYNEEAGACVPMGEFQKQIDSYAQQWIGYLHGKYDTNEPLKEMEHQKEQIMEDVTKTLEEAKKEFPLDRELIKVMSGNIDVGKLPLTFTVDVQKIIEWFEKWFGK